MAFHSFLPAFSQDSTNDGKFPAAAFLNLNRQKMETTELFTLRSFFFGVINKPGKFHMHRNTPRIYDIDRSGILVVHIYACFPFAALVF